MTTSLVFVWALVVGVAIVGVALAVLLVTLLRRSSDPHPNG